MLDRFVLGMLLWKVTGGKSDFFKKSTVMSTTLKLNQFKDKTKQSLVQVIPSQPIQLAFFALTCQTLHALFSPYSPPPPSVAMVTLITPFVPRLIINVDPCH